MKSIPRIEVLFADFGSGHRSIANALTEAIKLVEPKYDVRPIDGLRQSTLAYYKVTAIYPFVVNHARWLYRLFYIITNGPLQTRVIKYVLYLIAKPTITNYLRRRNVELFISCHPLFTLLLPEVIKSVSPRTKIISVITDPFTPHAHNFSPKVDLCIVGSEAAKDIAIKQKVPQQKVVILRHPISPTFQEHSGNRLNTLTSLNLNIKKTTILLMGGGDGLGQMYKIVSALCNSELPIQLITICGRNTNLQNKLLGMETKIVNRVLGYVENVSALMDASEILVSKAGPCTLYEAFASRLPIIIIDAILGQEKGNVDLVLKYGAGYWCPSPMQVVCKVEGLIKNGSIRKEMSLASFSLSDSYAAIKTAQECLKLMQ
ncbi:MAG: MGDG synthase family glycosyltransferase [Paludibacteraceae bacterium]